MRTYTIGVDPKTKRETITVHNSLKEMPFNVWRDVGRIAGCWSETPNSITFEFLVSGRVAEAEKVLQGAMWARK